MSDRIEVAGIRAHGYHGVFDHEKREGQTFLADVTYTLDTRAAARGDALAASVSYAEVAALVHARLAGPSVDLLETLAEAIARDVLGAGPLSSVRVRVHKPEAPIDVDFADVCVTIERTPLTVVPENPREVVLGLGGNLGDVPTAIERALALLGERLGALQVAPLYRSTPVLAPGQADQPDYVNTVAIARSDLAADEVLALAQAVENRLGRERHERWGARVIDVDVIDVEGLTSSAAHLTIPHPRAAERSFVVRPYLDLRPDGAIAGTPLADLAVTARGEAHRLAEGEGQ
ncbi:MAG: 2-amino-4-hydroxy-6-hydroxymethyldihydropteridine diphosphokinase [Bowdeniella nasicola]|nr:2-amino-4-hydroxy-6-hydroxymethyldihydropteridine diphosphokinase [Bowdeniella nasicola]